MEIKINRPEEPEGAWFGDTAIIDRGGLDILFEDGRRYSANWGAHEAYEIGEELILNDFREGSQHEREEIYESLCALTKALGNHLD